MNKAAAAFALLLALCLSACSATQYRLSYEDVDAMDNVKSVDFININGYECDYENGEDRFRNLLAELQLMYDGELKGGELKFVVLWWYRNGSGGYIAVLPALTYHSDIFTLGFGGIAELGVMTLKEDRDARDLIGFSRYNGHGFCIIGTLENYEFFGDPEDTESGHMGILKEYSWMLGPFKLYTKRSRVDFGEYEQ